MYIDGNTYSPDIEQMAYETRSYPVLCAYCQIADIGTEQDLRADGWLLSEVEICPKCLAKTEFREIGPYARKVEQEFRKAA